MNGSCAHDSVVRGDERSHVDHRSAVEPGMPLPPHVNEDDVWLYGLEGSRCQFSECRLADSVRARLDFFRISNPSASVATRKDRLDPNSGDGRE